MRSCIINKITIGGDAPVRVMGVINCSPESFYGDSFIPTNEIHAANDIAGLMSPAYAKRVADAGLPAIVMASDQQAGDAVGVAETHKAIATVMQRCEAAGIDNYVLDPGIGLWTPLRSVDDDWELSRHFDGFLKYDRPLLAAVSRKSFIGQLLDKFPQDRLAGSLAVTMTLLQKGASVVRTHDVKETVDMVKVYERLVKQR